MRIDASGNLGVGTTTVSDKLHVAGSTSTYIRVTSSNASTGAGARFVNATSTWLIGAGPTSGGSEFAITDSTSGTNERLRITSTGLVGINDTTPTYQLDVGGDINTSGVFRVSDTQVVTSRRTGWAAPTGTATRTTFATSTVTTAQLAERVKALIDDLTTHGLIGA
jgi:hypothetical protein